MGLESLTPIGLGLDATSQLFKTIYGITQMIKGNKGLKNLQRPVYSPDENIVYNQQLAGQIASQGIPDSAKNFYADSIDRGLSSTISAVQGGGGNLGQINQAFGNSTDAFRNLLAMDAQQKQQNQQVLMGANRDLAEENIRAFKYNKADPYNLEYQKYTQMTNSGAQNAFGGGQGLGADAIGFGDYFGGKSGSGGSNEDMFKQFMKWMQTQQMGSGGLYGGFQGSVNTGNIG